MDKIVTIWKIQLIEDGANIALSEEFYLDYEKAKEHKAKLEEIYQGTKTRVRLEGEILWI